jgi:hypothetical protein
MDPTANPTDEEVPLDLSALDADADVFAESRLVRRVMTSRRAVYPVRRDLLLGVWTLRRYVAFASAAALLLWIVRTRQVEPPQTVIESIGVPMEFMDGARVLPASLKR